MAMDIDVLNLERAITGLTCTIRDTSERTENMAQSLASIADALCSEDGILESLKRIADAVCAKAPARRRTRAKSTLTAVG